MIKNGGTSGCYDLQLVKFKCAQIVISLCGVPSILSRIVWENGSCLGSESLVFVRLCYFTFIWGPKGSQRLRFFW